MYPCLYNNGTNFGASVKWLLDPLNVTLPLSLFVSVLKEPNIRRGESAVEMTAILKVSGLTPNVTYFMYRYSSYDDWPDNSAFYNSTYAHKFEFNASLSEFDYFDPVPIWSNETAYYAVTNTTLDLDCIYPGTC